MNSNEFLTLDFLGLMKLITNIPWILVREVWRNVLESSREKGCERENEMKWTWSLIKYTKSVPTHLYGHTYGPYNLYGPYVWSYNGSSGDSSLDKLYGQIYGPYLLYGPYNRPYNPQFFRKSFSSTRLISNPYGTFLTLVYHFINNLGDVITLLPRIIESSLTHYS